MATTDLDEDQVLRLIRRAIKEDREARKEDEKERTAELVKTVLHEERTVQNEALDAMFLRTASQLLTGFGIDEEDRKEFKEDFRYLRRLRHGSEKLTGLTLTAAVTVVVGGIASALWIGIKSLAGR